MFAFNHEPLRARLTTDFNALACGVKDAVEVSRILAALTQTTTAIMSELAQAWTASNSILRLVPDEMLALSFSVLPFADRIAASQVSRRWRAVALAHPAIWADLDFDRLDSTYADRIFHALSRTGCLPVDLRVYIDPDPTDMSIVKKALRLHMHHLRTIEGAFPQYTLPLLLPAPYMETISSVFYHVDIPSGFLGGQPERLRTLRLPTVTLPETCPALSTVAFLTLDGPKDHVSAATFRRLFQLCPNLVSLRLNELQSLFSDYLPPGPAPSSLKQLRLEGDDDVTPHYNAWQTANLRQVSLMQRTMSAAHLDRLFTGAWESLTVNVDYAGDVELVIQCAAGRRHSIKSTGDNGRTTSAALVTLSRISDLQHVRAIEVSLFALKSFLPVVAALPALKHVTILVIAQKPHLSPGGTRKAIRTFPWHLLRDLENVVRSCPWLGAIDVAVECPGRSRGPLTPEDASGLIDQLSEFDEFELPDIRIGGFPRDIVRDVDIPELCGVRVEF
ncbi:hypothetical protein AURDEDRAFT_187257 [Auricularia subglabra TFB-10046 SS5]|uniref:F-box domain-containing protein n=1 Tax=Auricularia subglabra (strain TFB-10046 / SS5) TaxID=717982 RepID=J0WXR2_AURST|nr:hypothetical protein AURDEDRAFT_187257 [Auricularia subglabra TFB-10046 SS5]